MTGKRTAEREHAYDAVEPGAYAAAVRGGQVADAVAFPNVLAHLGDRLDGDDRSQIVRIYAVAGHIGLAGGAELVVSHAARREVALGREVVLNEAICVRSEQFQRDAERVCGHAEICRSVDIEPAHGGRAAADDAFDAPSRRGDDSVDGQAVRRADDRAAGGCGDGGAAVSRDAGHSAARAPCESAESAAWSDGLAACRSHFDRARDGRRAIGDLARIGVDGGERACVPCSVDVQRADDLDGDVDKISVVDADRAEYGVALVKREVAAHQFEVDVAYRAVVDRNERAVGVVAAALHRRKVARGELNRISVAVQRAAEGHALARGVEAVDVGGQVADAGAAFQEREQFVGGRDRRARSLRSRGELTGRELGRSQRGVGGRDILRSVRRRRALEHELVAVGRKAVLVIAVDAGEGEGQRMGRATHAVVDLAPEEVVEVELAFLERDLRGVELDLEQRDQRGVEQSDRIARSVDVRVQRLAALRRNKRLDRRRDRRLVRARAGEEVEPRHSAEAYPVFAESALRGQHVARVDRQIVDRDLAARNRVVGGCRRRVERRRVEGDADHGRGEFDA